MITIMISKVLRDQRLKQDQRRQDETRDRLGNIQDRISRALSKYDLGINHKYCTPLHQLSSNHPPYRPTTSTQYRDSSLMRSEF